MEEDEMFTVHEELPAMDRVDARTRLSPERRVRTSLPAIDSFQQGFRSSSVSLIDSSDRFLFDLTHLLCVNAVGVLNDEVVWVDGGNSIDPHEIAGLCKRFRMDIGGTLDSINIARAFTAYQMTSLIVDRLEEEVVQRHAGTVIVSCFPDLFHDRDMRWSEAFQLMKRCVSTLRDITRRYDLVTIITNYGLVKIDRRRSLRTLMHDSVDSVLRIENRRKALRFSLVKEGRTMIYLPVPYYQTTLDEFMG